MTANLERIDDDLLRSLILEAWRMTAPKRLAASLDPTDRACERGSQPPAGAIRWRVEISTRPRSSAAGCSTRAMSRLVMNRPVLTV